MLFRSPYLVFLDLQDPVFSEQGEAKRILAGVRGLNPEAVKLAKELQQRGVTSRDLHARYEALSGSARKRFFAVASELENAGFPSSSLGAFLLERRFFEGEKGEAVRVSAQYLERFPFDEELNPLFRLRLWLDNPAMVPNIRAAIENFQRRFPHQADQAERPQEEEVARWIESDLKEMKRLFDRQGIRYVFMTYPPNVIDLSSR